ncbi:MAG TPA: hypothetical protein VN937_19635 [Blastocatellia bacterium]|nr:hypothetical protein [Blastocatellia bacterium]
MKLVTISLLLLLIIVAIAWLIPSNAAQTPIQSSSDQKTDATPIQVGVMSEKQRIHSRLLESEGDRYKAVRRLDEFVDGQPRGAYIEPPLEITSPDVPRLSFPDFIKALMCEADAVVTAVVTDRTSQLTEQKKFVFTDYTMLVKEIYKGHLDIAPNTGITVMRPGGKVSINGRIVTAIDSSYQLLESDKRYLLFLRYIPETGAYRSERKGTFLIDSESVIPQTEEFVPGLSTNSSGSLVSIRPALLSGCEPRRK